VFSSLFSFPEQNGDGVGILIIHKILVGKDKLLPRGIGKGWHIANKSFSFYFKRLNKQFFHFGFCFQKMKNVICIKLVGI
jgi:hypothetical protein